MKTNGSGSAMNFLKSTVTVLRSSACLLSNPLIKNCRFVEQQLTRLSLSRCIHSSPVVKRPLNEFLDDPDNFALENIYVGRPWRKDELRLKSNDDLHKLWYVLLKERNMLMTMEQLAYDQTVPLAGPERIFKVEESMENLMSVVKERDVAYNLLNFHSTGQPRRRVTRNFAGVPVMRTEKENYVPREHNSLNQVLFPELKPWMVKHVAKYEQKLRKKYRYNQAKCLEKQRKLMQKFPHLKPEDVAHIKPNDRKLKLFLKMSAELNDQDFKERRVYGY